MKQAKKLLATTLLLLFFQLPISAQEIKLEDPPLLPTGTNYQLYLTKPAKEIKQLLYHKNCAPINGHLNDDRKRVIMEDFNPDNKVYLHILYEDGTEEDFTRSPCFIDPVLL